MAPPAPVCFCGFGNAWGHWNSRCSRSCKRASLAGPVTAKHSLRGGLLVCCCSHEAIMRGHLAYVGPQAHSRTWSRSCKACGGSHCPGHLAGDAFDRCCRSRLLEGLKRFYCLSTDQITAPVDLAHLHLSCMCSCTQVSYLVPCSGTRAHSAPQLPLHLLYFGDHLENWLQRAAGAGELAGLGLTLMYMIGQRPEAQTVK